MTNGYDVLAPVDSSPMPDAAAPQPPTPRSDTLRAYFDPANLLHDANDEAFIESIKATRSIGIARGIGRLTAAETIYMDATLSCIDDIDHYAPQLGVGMHRMAELTQRAHDQADIVAGHIITTLDEHIDAIRKHPSFTPLMEKRLPSRLLMAGKVLAAVAHQGDKRISGDDYFRHPDRAATVLTIGWRRQYGEDDDTTLDVLRFLTYCHDAYEETVVADSSHLFTKPIIVTPLLAMKVAERLGAPNPLAIAKTLLVLTRTKDVDGNDLPYFEYVDRIADEQPELGIIPKVCDVVDNDRIDPVKGSKRKRSQKKYAEAQRRLQKHAQQLAIASNMAVASMFTVNRDQVYERESAKFAVAPNKIAQRVHENVDRSIGCFALAA